MLRISQSCVVFMDENSYRVGTVRDCHHFTRHRLNLDFLRWSKIMRFISR